MRAAPLALLAGILAAGGTPRLRAQDSLPADTVVVHRTVGGSWRQGRSQGHYRLLVLRGARGQPSKLVIQWVEVGAAPIVRDTRIVNVITDPWRLDRPQFIHSIRYERALVVGRQGSGSQTATWVLTLGAPGIYSVSPLPPPGHD